MRIKTSKINTGNRSRFFYCLFFILCNLFSIAQGDKKSVKLGLQYAEQEVYDMAVNYFNNVGDISAQNERVLLTYLECLIQRRELAKADQICELIEVKSKGNPFVDFYYKKGRLFHLLGSFDEAIRYYRLFLKKSEKEHVDREKAKDLMLSASYGRRNNTYADNINVKLLSEKINTNQDELRALFSNTINGVLYYSTKREDVLGGRRNVLGEQDEFGQFRADIYKADHLGKERYRVSPLSYLLNGIGEEVLCGFSGDGTVLYFGKGNSLDDLRVYVDVFEEDVALRKIDPTPLYRTKMIFTEKGLPYFFSKDIMLFASDQFGGYGGYDLFLCYRINEEWSQPENLGPEVNSPFNEVSPFLAKNGRTLYYSTDNPKISHGGYDIIRSVFREHSYSWSEPENLGKPINSTANDFNFSLSKTGVQGLFTSDRQDGVGGLDIYKAEFIQKREEQITFAVSSVIGRNLTSIRQGGEEEQTAPQLRPLYYGEGKNLLSVHNKSYLNEIVRFMMDRPHLRLVLEVHSDDKNADGSVMYLSYRRGRQVKDYLMAEGLGRDRIHLRALGGQYPMAKYIVDGQENTEGAILNRRVDVRFWSMNDDYLFDDYLWPEVDSLERDEAFDYFSELSAGISFSVEVYTSKVNNNAPVLRRYSNLAISDNKGTDSMSYQLGLFRSLEEAKRLQNSLELLGYDTAEIKVYLNGYLLEGEELQTFKGRFPGIEWP